MTLFVPAPILIFTAMILFSPGDAAGETISTTSSATNLESFYDRLAVDLLAGKPLVTTAYIALCDNASQGIVPVKNPKICDGDVPERNLYWNTSGGLWAWARKHGWRRVHQTKSSEGPVLVKAVWRKRMRPGGELRARGVRERFDAYIVGLAYRGRKIDQAMTDYLRAVNSDIEQTVLVKDDVAVSFGGSSHVVGYIGHDYFLDVRGADEARLMREHEGKSRLAKGSFALACVGNEFIRPAITRENVYIFILNKQLAFPGVWTAGGIINGVAAGENGKRIHRRAARDFANGMDKPKGAILRSFAWGP